MISGSVHRGVSSHPHYVVKEEQPTNRLYMAMSFSELLGAARNCTELLGAARGCSGLLGAAWGCPGLLKLLINAQDCLELLRGQLSIAVKF